MSTTPETGTKIAIKQWLQLRGIFWWYNLAGVGSQKGIPDLCALHKGVFYGIEVKSKTGKLTEHQMAFERATTAAGGTFVLARDLDDVMSAIPV